MTQKTVNLALQGGGAHGAFTWGVLEELLLDERLTFKTISGTSAGAMNGAVMVYGLVSGGASEGRAKAIELLESFWKQVSASGRFGLFSGPNVMDQFMGGMSPMNAAASGAFMGFDMMSRYFSPYQFNPLGLNPLRDILLNVVDFNVLRETKEYNLHVAATDVLRCHLKLFTGKELSVDAFMASSCLPQLFQAVEIDGSYYWDGGYMGNPTLFPLTQCRASHDIMIVQIDPITRKNLPRTAEAIMDRLNEISFNSPLLVELKGLHLVNQLLHKGHLKEECGLRKLHIHIVGDDDGMGNFSLESKFNPDWDFLSRLRSTGRQAAKKWLAAHYGDLGKASTIDLEKLVA
jgi:NTE family protein